MHAWHNFPPLPHPPAYVRKQVSDSPLAGSMPVKDTFQAEIDANLTQFPGDVRTYMHEEQVKNQIEKKVTVTRKMGLRSTSWTCTSTEVQSRSKGIAY